MDIIKFAIKRPVTLFMSMCVAVILGIVSLTGMDMELMSSIDIPVALVMTTYTGAGPEEVESLVTKPIEGAVANVEGIDTIQSTSSEGTSFVIAQFDYGTDMDEAITDMKDKIDMIEMTLPEDADAPTVLKMDMNSTPVANIAITSDTLSNNELLSLVEDTLQPRFERQSDVASVDLTGGKETEFIIEINPDQMEGLGLSMSQIAGILAAENQNQSGGSIDYGNKSLTISSKLKMTDINDIKQTPIILGSGAVVQLQDIATVTEKEKEVTSISRYSGEECISLSISKSSDGNAVSVVSAIQKEIAKIASEYPEINIAITTETGSIIEDSVNGVLQNIVIGAGLSIIILFVFLKNIGLTAIIAISMPLSIIITLILLYFCDVSLNVISLGGLSIGVGMLVDNSVVVIENIYRYRTSEGFNKIKGTYRATKEVLSSVFASTLTTIVIFVPFVFAEGMVKEVFMDLALSVVFSLVASLVCSVTVVPMIAGNYVNNVHRNKAPKVLNFINVLLDLFDRFITGLSTGYGKLLRLAIRCKKRTLLVIICIFLASMSLFPLIGMELMPVSDEGMLSVTIETPVGSNIDVVNELSTQAENYLSELPEVVNLMTSITGPSSSASLLSTSSSSSTITVELLDKNERSKSSEELAEEVRNYLTCLAGGKVTVSASSSMGALSSGGVEVNIYGEDMETLKEISLQLEQNLVSIDGVRQITNSMDDAKKQVMVIFNKDQIRKYGLTGMEVASQIRATIRGNTATTIKTDGTETDVRIIYPESSYATLNNLGDMSIKTNAGIYIPLSAVAEITLEETQTSITRSDQKRFITVSCDIFGRDMGSVNKDVKALLDQMTLPDGYTFGLGGTNEMMEETFSSLILVIVLAVILVYAVMAAQFESLINPFVIMFTIPLALTGVFILLFLFDEAISMTSLLGCLVLVGIVVNNGIILIDYIDTLRERDHLPIEDAVLKACPTRLRPVLMTGLTTILGQIPVIMATNANSEMLRGMGIVIAGGLATSTVLTLLFVPILYMYSDKFTSSLRRIFKLKQKKNAYEIDAECC